MPLHSQPVIERVPFEVLSEIIGWYRCLETVHYPLESLLLVSRSWNAALTHTVRIWGTFEVYLEHSLTSLFWEKHVASRLARSGPASALNIRMYNLLDCEADLYPKERERASTQHRCEDQEEVECPCYEAARECAMRCLQTLAGIDGEHCHRWKSLILDLGHDEHDNYMTREEARPFCFPTPNLDRLDLINVWVGRNSFEAREEWADFLPFPETGRLIQFMVVDCDVPNLPDFKTAGKAVLAWRRTNDSFNPNEGFQTLEKLRVLHIDLQPVQEGAMDVEFFLPPELLHLRELRVSGRHFPHFLYECRLPRLRTLGLQMRFEDLLSRASVCDNVDWDSLTRLDVDWQIPEGMDIEQEIGFNHFEDVQNSLRGFIVLAPNIELIYASPMYLHLVLRVLWRICTGEDRASAEGQEDVYFNHDVEVTMEDYAGMEIRSKKTRKSYVITGEETPETFMELAKKWRVTAPDVSATSVARTILQERFQAANIQEDQEMSSQ